MSDNGSASAQARNKQTHSRFHGRVGDGTRQCECPGCPESGDFRAPRHRGSTSSDAGDRWRWFCLEHVRRFNAGYDYFEGMDSADIERAQRVYRGWESETRAFTRGGDPEPAWMRFTDPADMLGARFTTAASTPPVSRNGQILAADDLKALKVLGLDSQARLSDIRRAYADRVRRFHPDRNGGDRSHERALQAVISAYTHLRKAPAFS